MASKWHRLRYGGPPPAPVAIVCTNRGGHGRTVLPGVHVFTHSGHVELSIYHHGIRLTGASQPRARHHNNEDQDLTEPRKRTAQLAASAHRAGTLDTTHPLLWQIPVGPVPTPGDPLAPTAPPPVA
ncbi:MAG: hypothetical protein K0R68_2983 [Mycobacterium sp.]|jgi:hypothetical protein|nr:hypothetical protein [Mycobacterium sp.]